MLREFTGGHGPLAEELQDASAGRIRQSFEDSVHASIFS